MTFQALLLQYMEACFQHTMQGVYQSPEYLLEPDPNAVLLDCGCHNGEHSFRLGTLLNANSIYGLDLNQGLTQEAVNQSVRVVCADLNSRLPFASESITVVTAFNVLEHLVETERFLRELYRVLTPGGYTIINTPNLASWHNIAALLLGLQPFSGPNIISMTESDIPVVRRMHRRAHQLPEEPKVLLTVEPERYRHIVVVAFRSLIKALQMAGFTVETALGFGYYPLPPALTDLAARIDPSHAHHMVIKARKPR